MSSSRESLRFRLEGQGWIIAAVWLLFLIFPLISIWTSDLSLTRQWLGTGLLAAFGAAYLLGFHHAQRWYHLQDCLPFEAATAAPHRHLYLGAMGLFLATGFVVAGVGVLGAASFIAAFASFNLTWRGALVTNVATITTVVVVPVLVGEPFLGLLFGGICLMVAATTLLTRSFEESEQQQTRLETKLAVVDERARLARDVHDVIGHNLTATILKVELSRKLLDGVTAEDPDGQARLDRGRRELEELEAISRRSLAEIRATISGIRTADLLDELDAARGVLADAGVQATVRTTSLDELGPDHRSTLAWVVREAVTNVVRHARATECGIEVGVTEIDGEPVLLRIVDNGVGFGGAEGNGLTGLRERLEPTGLSLRIESAIESGADGGRRRGGTDLRVIGSPTTSSGSPATDSGSPATDSGPPVSVPVDERLPEVNP